MSKTKNLMCRQAKALAVCALTALGALSSPAQELIYQEDFETDGEAANPQRYTTVGKDVYEIDRKAELNNQDQLGPVFFAHNNEVSFVGVPGVTLGRRMVMAWDLAISSAEASPAMLELYDSGVKWLLNNKAKAKIVVIPGGSVESLGVLGKRLIDAGHELVADDTGVAEADVATQGDMLFKVGGDSRGGLAKLPMLLVSSSNADEVLIANTGSPTPLESKKGKIEVPGHPAAGGKTGEFDIATGTFTYELLGNELPFNSIILASFTALGEDPPVTRPLIMLMNGPNDTPKGVNFGGGPFRNFSGKRFFGGAGINKWTLPDQLDRSLTLRPINVAGKKNVKLTIALAGTFLDFERSSLTRGGADYLEVAIDTDGNGPNEFQRLMFFTPPSGSDKFVNDFETNPAKPTRLGLEFKDVTYDIPATATSLVIQLRLLSTWWNEVFAFDNIRVTAGDIAVPKAISVARSGADVVITYTGGVLHSSATVNGTYTAEAGAASPLTVRNAKGARYYLVK